MKRNAPELIRVSYPASTELSGFDPAKVQLAQQYFVLENLYGTLIERNPSGNLVAGLSSQFGWDGDEIFFEIRPNLKASDGLPLTVKDAYFSFMRLLVLGTGTHGDLQKLICPTRRPTGVTDSCEGLRVDGNRLFLRPGKRNPAIFDQFATIDFAIIPQRAVDPESLQIMNYSVTSGSYAVAERGSNGALTLRANTHSPRYSLGMPQKAVFVPTDGTAESSLELFRNNEVDFVSTLETSNVSRLFGEFSKIGDVQVHATQKVRLELAHFTSRGLKLPALRRWAIGCNIARAYRHGKAGQPGLEVAEQYFPKGGVGSLSSSELTPISKRRSDCDATETGKGLTIGAMRRSFSEMKSLLEPALPEARFVEISTLPEYETAENRQRADFPDIYVITMDTGFLELMPNIANTVKSGFFGETPEDRSEWLDAYLREGSEDNRHASLRAFHKQSLESPVIIPLVRTPYVGILRKPWVGHFSTFFPNVPLWQISTE